MATHSSVLAWRIPGTGAWWAAIYGVAQSQTRLKLLSKHTAVTRKMQIKTTTYSPLHPLLLLLLSHFSHVRLRATP